MKALIAIAVLLIPALCWGSPSSARAKAIIAVIDAAEDTFQPELPDSLNKTGGSLTAFPDTGQVAPPAVAVVTVYTKPGSADCDNMKADTKGYTALDFRFQAKEYPPWVKDRLAAGETFPFAEWKSANPRGSYSSGWPGLAAWLKRYNASLKPAAAGVQSSSSLQPLPGSNPAAARVHYPIRGSWWTGCGSWQHLASGEHSGKFDQNWLRSLSWAEIQSLHSDDHEHRVKWAYVVRPSSIAYAEPRRTKSYRGLSYSFGCPNGLCPRGG